MKIRRRFYMILNELTTWLVMNDLVLAGLFILSVVATTLLLGYFAFTYSQSHKKNLICEDVTIIGVSHPHFFGSLLFNFNTDYSVRLQDGRVVRMEAPLLGPMKYCHLEDE